MLSDNPLSLELPAFVHSIQKPDPTVANALLKLDNICINTEFDKALKASIFEEDPTSLVSFMQNSMEKIVTALQNSQEKYHQSAEDTILRSSLILSMKFAYKSLEVLEQSFSKIYHPPESPERELKTRMALALYKTLQKCRNIEGAILIKEAIEFLKLSTQIIDYSNPQISAFKTWLDQQDNLFFHSLYLKTALGPLCPPINNEIGKNAARLWNIILKRIADNRQAIQKTQENDISGFTISLPILIKQKKGAEAFLIFQNWVKKHSVVEPLSELRVYPKNSQNSTPNLSLIAQVQELWEIFWPYEKTLHTLYFGWLERYEKIMEEGSKPQILDEIDAPFSRGVLLELKSLLESIDQETSCSLIFREIKAFRNEIQFYKDICELKEKEFSLPKPRSTDEIIFSIFRKKPPYQKIENERIRPIQHIKQTHFEQKKIKPYI